MAEAFANKYGKDKVIAYSAGNKPAEKVNPVVVEILKEKDIDISINKPKLITAKMANEVDLVVPWVAMTKEFALGHSSSQQSNGTLKIQKGSP